MTFNVPGNITIFFIIFVFAMGTTGASGVTTESDQPCIENRTSYTIQSGDRLYSIGRKFGSGLFWEAIYIMNAEKISNPHYIYPGQKITIPFFIANFTEYGFPLRDVLHQPFCTTGEIEKISWDDVDYAYLYSYDESEMSPLLAMARAAARKTAGDTDDSAGKADISDGQAEDETLKAFREAFESLVRQEEEERRREEEQAASERQMFVEIDGMIHDETRSKIGRDFYDIFYASWQSPPSATNYSIRITEQPAPNLGTIIAVQVNNTETFRSRLQPRYDLIEEASQFAVRRTYMFLQQNQQQYMIY